MNRTTQTYNRIAHTYLEANRNRKEMEQQLDLFAKLLPDNALVADIGCGPGVDSAELANRNLNTIGLDLSWGMLTANPTANTQFVQANMCHLPLCAGCVDGVWANASLLHLNREQSTLAVSGFHRLLRADGVLMLAVKQGEGASYVQKSYGHNEPRFFNYWGSAELDTFITKHSFTILESWVSIIPNKEPWLIRIARKQ